MTDIILITHNLRSTHNVGSLLRTAEGIGVKHVYLTGYSPYPKQEDDDRLPYIAVKLDAQIAKTALGAEKFVQWSHVESVEQLLASLKNDGFTICALEQTERSLDLPSYHPATKLALLVGREVEGIEPEIVDLCDDVVEIPMHGQKESFNVVQAAAMALYHLRFMS